MIEHLTEVVMPIAMFTMMFSMGLTLSLEDFKHVMVVPKAVMVGLIIQLLLLPAIGFALASCFTLQTMVAVGFVALAACPGGTLSNLVVHLGKGHTALSITLTVTATMATLLSLPLWINYALRFFGGTETTVEIPLLRTAIELGMFTLAPVMIGLFARSKAPDLEKIERYLSRGSALTIFLVFVAASILNEGESLSSPGEVLLPCVLLTVIAVLLGFGIPRILGINAMDSATTAVEICLKNVILALFVVTNSLHDMDAAQASVVYMAGMVPAAIAIMIVYNYFKKAPKKSDLKLGCSKFEEN